MNSTLKQPRLPDSMTPGVASPSRTSPDVTSTGVTSTGRSGILVLAMLLCVIGLIWLIVLPHMAQQPQMKAHLNWLNARGIDPSAMYYTELEAMEPILQRLERRPANSSTKARQ
ncbi:MAG: hypothetical protein RIK87_00645 [Fuerstiella sp.]